MKPLNITDQLFLHMEKRHQPMHIGTLMIFSYPKTSAPDSAATMFNHLKSFTLMDERSQLKLTRKWGQHYWEKDKEFDIDHHIKHSALPKPYRIQSLLDFVSTQHGNPIHRERPLWEIHFIEGVEENRFALYMKVHHSVADGASGNQALQKLLSKNREHRWTTKTCSTASVETDKNNEPQPTVLNVIQSASSVIRNVGKKILEDRTKRRSVFGLNAPQTILNTPITGSRIFSAHPYDLQRFRKIGDFYNATINDVVLAVCGSVLRAYLLSKNSLPEKPLIAMIPVSMRDINNESTAGNEIAFLQSSLGTNIGCPETRMLAIKKSINDAKDQVSNMTREEYLIYSSMSFTPGVFHLATGLGKNWLPCNVMISNIPGPSHSLYLNGAELHEIYPVSIPFDRVPLNITVMSYNGKINFGLTACRQSIESNHCLMDNVEQALTDFEELISPPKKNRVEREKFSFSSTNAIMRRTSRND